MKCKLKKYKLLITSFIISILLSFIVTTLYYTNIIGDNLYDILIFSIDIILLLVIGFFFGKRNQIKGISSGLIVGFITIILFFLISIVFFKDSLSLKNILYYVIILISMSFGAIIGKNKKR